MPSHLKELVRARMAKTGESYQSALRHVRAAETRAAAAPSTPSVGENVVRSRTVADTKFSIGRREVRRLRALRGIRISKPARGRKARERR